MNATRAERWDASSGVAAFAAGVAGAALERGWPNPSNPVAVAVFVEEHRAPILSQSMLFVLSTALFMWFLGSLRSFLLRSEGGAGRLSTVVFGAGYVWAGLNMAAQALQIGVAMDATRGVQPALLSTMAAVFSISNLPLAVMLIASAVVSLRTRAFPKWLSWLTAGAGAAEVLLWLGTVSRSGPLAPNGWLTYALYPALAVWLLPTTIVMFRRSAPAAEQRTGTREGPTGPGMLVGH